MSAFSIKRSLLSTLLPLAATSVASTAALAEEVPIVPLSTQIQEAITSKSKAKVNFRLRHENVNETGSSKKDATALTLRTRLNYDTGRVYGLAATIEADNIQSYDDNHDSGINGQTAYAAITDPKGTFVNQAVLTYTGLENALIKVGRQKISLDNERFVGAVGFRQHEQSFDAATVSYQPNKDITLYYGYLNKANRIFGSDNLAQGVHGHNTHLANVRYQLASYGALSGYAYLMDNEKTAAMSNDTYGLRFTGIVPEFNDKISAKYNLEYATQQGAYDNPVDYSADYYAVDATVGTPMVTVGVGYEVMGSDKSATTISSGAATTKAFQTPLATLHKFNGWADLFLAGGAGAPNVGIEDVYITLGGKVKGFAWSINGHQYKAAEPTATVSDLGSEFGASLDKTVLGKYTLGIKYANYNVGDTLPNFNDREKLWLTASTGF